MAAAVSDSAHKEKKEKKKKKRSALIHQVQTHTSQSSYARVRVTFVKRAYPERFCIQMAAEKNNCHFFIVEPASPVDVNNAERRQRGKTSLSWKLMPKREKRKIMK